MRFTLTILYSPVPDLSKMAARLTMILVRLNARKFKVQMVISPVCLGVVQYELFWFSQIDFCLQFILHSKHPGALTPDRELKSKLLN